MKKKEQFEGIFEHEDEDNETNVDVIGIAFHNLILSINIHDLPSDSQLNVFQPHPFRGSMSEHYRRQYNLNIFKDKIDDEDNWEGHWNLN
jgi:hypothetical protein